MGRKAKRVNRGTVIALAMAAAFAVVLAVTHASGAYHALTQALSGGASTDQGDEHEVLDASWSCQAGETLDLTGTYVEESKDAKGWHGREDSWDFAEDLSWYGTMRITASKPVWYPSAEAAQFADIYDESSGWGVVVVTLHIENVDAQCRESVRDIEGADCILLSMFELVPTTGESLSVSSSAAELWEVDAPRVEGLPYQSDKAISYTWVPQGTSADIRLGYRVFGQDNEDASRNGEVSYYLVVNPFNRVGTTSGLPVIALGPVQDSTGSDAS